MVGSGFPLAEQMSDTLLPSFTVMSEEMSYIFGGTREKRSKKYRNKISISNLQPLVHPLSSIRNITLDACVSVMSKEIKNTLYTPSTLGKIILGSLYSDSIIQSDIAISLNVLCRGEDVIFPFQIPSFQLLWWHFHSTLTLPQSTGRVRSERLQRKLLFWLKIMKKCCVFFLYSIALWGW